MLKLLKVQTLLVQLQQTLWRTLVMLSLKVLIQRSKILLKQLLMALMLLLTVLTMLQLMQNNSTKLRHN